MTEAEQQAVRLIGRAVRPLAIHTGPISAQMASDALADLAEAVLVLDRPLSEAMKAAIGILKNRLLDEIMA